DDRGEQHGQLRVLDRGSGEWCDLPGQPQPALRDRRSKIATTAPPGFNKRTGVQEKFDLKTKKGFAPELLASCLILGVAVAELRAQAPTANWPALRGANTAGVSSGVVPTTWDVGSSRNVAWKTPIPGLAHSSPIVWGDRVYVTTAVAARGRPGVETRAGD